MLLGTVHRLGVLVAWCPRWISGLNLCSTDVKTKGKRTHNGQKLETPEKVSLKSVWCIAFYMLLNDFSNPNKICDWEDVHMDTCVSKEQKNLLY